MPESMYRKKKKAGSSVGEALMGANRKAAYGPEGDVFKRKKKTGKDYTDDLDKAVAKKSKVSMRRKTARKAKTRKQMFDANLEKAARKRKAMAPKGMKAKTFMKKSRLERVKAPAVRRQAAERALAKRVKKQMLKKIASRGGKMALGAAVAGAIYGYLTGGKDASSD